MANKTKTMLQIRKIFQLKDDGYSYRQMSRLTGIHRHTIVDYCHRIEQSRRSYQELLQLPDAELARLVSPPQVEVVADTRYQWLEERMEYYLGEMGRKGVTRQLLWEEYLLEQPDRYRRTQFYEPIARYKLIHQATLHLSYKPGERKEVDFAGDPMYYFDPSTGEKIECLVLVPWYQYV